MRSPGSSAVLVLLGVAGLALVGCGRAVTPVAPAAHQAPEAALRAGSSAPEARGRESAGPNYFYPLEVGNHWRSALRITYTVTFPNGDPPITLLDERFRVDRDLACIEPRAGRDYVVQHRVMAGTGLTFNYWERYRQDGSGLYLADFDIGVPPACAGASGRQTLDADAPSDRTRERVWTAIAAKVTDAGTQAAARAAWDRTEAYISAIQSALREGPAAGVLAAPGIGPQAGESITLAYPLRPGAHWNMLTNPPFEARVEGKEVLDLPVGRVPAWRIKLTGFAEEGPHDRNHIWYGREGLLKYSLHLEGPPRPSGVTITDVNEVLVDLSLTGRSATP